MKNSFKYLFLVVCIFCANLTIAQSVNILDDFTDGNYTSGPVWSVSSGSPSVNTAILDINSSFVKMSTPFSFDCSEWYIDLKSNSNLNSNRLRYYFMLINNSDPANLSADGYCIEYSSQAGDIWLKRLDNGTTQVDGSALGYYNGTDVLTTQGTIKITRNVINQFQIYLNGTLLITATDGTYASNLVQFQSIWVTTANAFIWSIDNIKYLVSALPIVLSNYEINCEEKNVNIKWTTTSQINNDYFTIEKSYDAFNFFTIANIKGEGNSNIENHYSYTDPQENKILCYYRLKQTDFNGESEFFKTLSSNCLTLLNTFFYPNPFKDYIFINSTDSEKKIKIFNLNNEQLCFITLNNEFQKLDLSFLVSGIYFFSYTDNDGKFHYDKFIKD